jgi:uncharacterized protein
MVRHNRDFQIFVKPVGNNCNLSCTYCYYVNNTFLSEPKAGKMDGELLENYIYQHLKASPYKEVFFSWHGGEPMLAGIDFYRKAVALQKKLKPDGYKIINGIQTNGTLINDEWGRFLAEEEFYAGISIDGPGDLHNSFRIHRNGGHSHNEVIEGYRLLKKHGVNTEILCVINTLNVKHPLEVYRFLKSLGTGFITFIPLVEKTDSGTEGVSEISVCGDEFGNFLCQVFDEWIEKDIGTIKIQIIEEALRTAFGQEHSLCVFRKHCGGVPVIEHNGDFYSCDHYVNSENLIGNIRNSALEELLDDDRQLAFGLSKETTLPGYCRRCEVLAMCNGECPKNRIIKTPDGDRGLNFLCSGYRKFFNHLMPFAEAVKAEWQKGG